MLTGSWVTRDAEETFRFGVKAGETAHAGDVWCLTGPLGAGKTAFVQGLGKGLGFDGRVTSPTFALQNQYDGRLVLHHFDWYRLLNSAEVAELGWEEWLAQSAVTAVEWGEKFPQLFPPTALKLEFEHLGESERRLVLTATTDKAEARAEEMIRCWPP